MFERFIGAIPPITLVAAIATPAMHPVQMFALLSGGVASLAVAAYHIVRIVRGRGEK